MAASCRGASGIGSLCKSTKERTLSTPEVVLVVGLGEVGRPLLNILSRTFECLGVDISPIAAERPCSVLHICYPFHIRDFVGATANYIIKYAPRLTIIHSTVAPGTTRSIQKAAGTDRVVYSPVRGKHARMEADMMRYKKFVAASSLHIAREAEFHLANAGFETASFRTLEIGELSKLLETTYLGLLVAWAQEIERFAESYGGSADEVNAYIREIDFLPSHIFPGIIGGHCVMPNIGILRAQFGSKFLDAIVESNELKQQQLQASAATAAAVR
jgi:UDP-N-acetyl-D-mannosaminuronate dehydrogenase